MRKIIITICIGISVIGIFAFPFLVKVKTECRTQYGVCPQDISNNLNFNNASLFATRNKVKKNIKSNPVILDYRTQYKLPNILLIDLVVKKPVFAVQGMNEGQIGLVDTEGRILEVVNETGLPTVKNIAVSIKEGEHVNEKNIFALKLIQGVYDMYQVGNGVIENDSLVVELPAQIKVLLPVSGDRDLILGALRLVYSKIISQEEGERYSEIDLRFKNPVIR